MWSKIPRVGIDLRCLANSEKSGVENYVYDLAAGLPDAASDIKFYYYFDRRIGEADLKLFQKQNVRIIKIPTKSNKIFNLLLRVLSLFHRINLFHFPISIIPRYFPVPAVITIYDLTYERYPEFYPQNILELQKTSVPFSAHQAVGILTISEATKKDLEEFYGIKSGQIFVTYPNVRNLEKTKQPRPYDFKYILCVGNIQPRKNLLNAVRAYAKSKTKPHLVIAGRMQDKQESLRLGELVDELKINSRVHITGFVNDRKLAALYQHCDFVLFPSFYEGFGYPIVEAFTYGKAIITGNTSSMSEIAGDSAVLVDPADPKSIAEGINKIGNQKAEYEKKGKKRLAALQNKSCAKETATAYHVLLRIK